MKLLKILLLLFTINCFLISFINSVNILPNDQYSINDDEFDLFENSKCLEDLDGYTSDFKANSFKANYPVGENKIIPISYSEIGKLSVSMKDQIMFVHFKMLLDNYIEGKLWGFQSNNTQYILMNINGTDTCISQTLQYPLPKKLSVKHIGNVNLGQTKCHVYQIKNAANYTNQELLVDTKNCAFMSSSVENPQSSSPGYALVNFYNFERKYHKSTFQLPPECYSIKPTTSPNPINQPLFLNHLYNNNN